MNNNTDIKPKPKKLFGIRNPILKAILIIAFIAATGGLGLVVVILAWAGDRLIGKRKGKVKTAMPLCLLMLALAGCSATDSVKEGVHLLQGEKLNTAISYLGYPDSKMEIEGDTIYEWKNNYTFTSMQAVSQPFSGSVYGAGGVTGYSGQTTAYVPYTHRNHCAIRLMVDKKSVIVGSAWKGNDAGCRGYAEGLDKLIEERKVAQP